jgi:two-component system CheB/CheR fusion protein
VSTGEPNAVTSVDGHARHVVVGVGASAGGLEALERFFGATPPTTGMTFVVVQHLSPDHRSLMAELLSKHTEMRVVQVEDGADLAPNVIYLLPPRKMVTVKAGRLRLEEKPGSSMTLPIDVLFLSLAEERGERAVAVVLSGTGSDGARGARAIKESGGLVAVQDPETARFDGMPRAAIATGIADIIAPVERLPAQIIRCTRTPTPVDAPRLAGGLEPQDAALGTIFSLLRQHSGVDFSLYKQSTVSRRIQRRMAVVEAQSLVDYAAVASESTREVAALYRELLIGVTRFFRDPKEFEALRRVAIMALLDETRPGDVLRFWVAGCSTGEEAYTLSIVIDECLTERGEARDIKVFATDIDGEALEFAGAGVYPESVAADLSPERLQRYFVRRGDTYQVARFLRQRVVFAHHDLTRDTPFSRVSLVTCRNVLIYFDSKLQRRVLRSFRFALKQGGYLLLGSSETVGDQAEGLIAIDPQCKLFQNSGPPPRHELNDGESRRERGVVRESGVIGVAPALRRAYDDLIAAYAPPTLLVNEQLEVLHYFGAPSPHIRVPAGAATHNLLHLLPATLSSILSLAVARAARDQAVVQYNNVPVESDDLDVTVRPIPGRADRTKLLMVSLDPRRAPVPTQRADRALGDEVAHQLLELQQELARSRETLQATIEELETSNEELQATNEELVASNEELQATNEELQSVNEELHSVNAEYQRKIGELVDLNDDVSNLLRATDVGTIFLDDELRITRFTPAVCSLVNVLERDVGRPMSHLSLSFDAVEFFVALRQVVEQGAPREWIVTLPDERGVLIRVAPYVVERGARRGLVVTFVDITRARRAERRVSRVIDALPLQICLLDRSGAVVLVNEAWRVFATRNGGTEQRTAVGANYLEVCARVAAQSGSESDDALRVLEGLRGVMSGRLATFEFEYPCSSPIERRWFMMLASPIGGDEGGLVVAHLDVTHRRMLLEASGWSPPQ